MPVLEKFGPATSAWFTGAFDAPTSAQTGAWESISRGDHTLVVAPTGSGKTLAAFLWALDKLSAEGKPEEKLRRCRVLYVSPLKALAVDVERNLRSPLAGIRQAAARLGLPEPDIEVAVRSGDTPADARRKFAKAPADILITTPESLFLMLTSQAREALRGVETVIVDEVHAVAGTKRGAHLALSLERLDMLLDRPAQRIGLSATVRPLETVARFLGGSAKVATVQPAYDKQWDLQVVVPVEDMSDGNSVWPHVEERIAELIGGQRSTLVFANSRRLAERLTARLNEIAAEESAPGLDSDEGSDFVFSYGKKPGESPPSAGVPAQVMAQSGASHGAPPIIARAHHGSVSKEQRAVIEDDLKAGRLPSVVATSSLELGIDMGAVDLVVQVEAPPSVASGLQRVGRAGHQVGAVSRGVLFPKYRGDLITTAVVAERMRGGLIEELAMPAHPLDVLAQQVVAIVCVDSWHTDELFTMVRRAAPYATLPRSAYEAVLDMLSGRYPSDEFAELRPRLVWDRVTGMLTARPGAQRLAVTSGGTIPDRGLFGVFLVGAATSSGSAAGASRVGELDEEMVYESRVGDVFTLGASSWRIEDITHDRVLVSPAPGQPGRLPFWKGDTPSRPAELGRAVGEFVRTVAARSPEKALERARAAGLDEWAAANLVSYLAEQKQATKHIPSDHTIVVERFRDELGDWRVCVHTPFGGAVHAPWSLAINARLHERYGVDVQAVYSDDGIVLRIPDTEDAPPGAELALFDPDEIEQIVTEEVGGSALFASRFRECAGRALLLPRRDPGRRAPLWQQRQRSAQLLAVASKYGSFPIVLETIRECLQDVYDLPGLKALLGSISSRKIRVVEVETSEPSPFAKSLTFGYIAAFMYEGDAPLAERRAAALTLDSSLLAELLGHTELRELLDPAVIEQTSLELQRLAEDRKVRDLEGLADLLRLLGPQSTAEAGERSLSPESVPRWLHELEGARRVIRVRVAGTEQWASIEDAGRLRDALGIPLPVGIPEAFTEPVSDPLGDLVARYARAHGPFFVSSLAERLGLGIAVVLDALRRLAASGRVTEGSFHNAASDAGIGSEWCDVGVLRTLRRRSLAALRKEVEPVEQDSLARFLPAWQHVGGRLRGVEGVLRAVEQLAGCPVPASALEPLVLASRVADYSPAMLDELMTSGEVLWAANGSLPGNDGWVSLHLADSADLTLPELEVSEQPLEPLQQTVLELLETGGAYYFRQISDFVAPSPGVAASIRSGGATSGDDSSAGASDHGSKAARPTDVELATALWDLVWSGRITNDTLAPLRTLIGGGRTAHRTRPAPSRARYGRARAPRAALPSRTGPPTVAGRWFLLPAREQDATRRAHAVAEALLDRHGVVTRGAAMAERIPGGYAGVYRVLSAFEEAGRCRRGYFVAGLGAAQFAMPGAVDRLRADQSSEATSGASGFGSSPGRSGTADESSNRRTLVLASTDPANPYGAALPWPDHPGAHRAARKAGALVVLVDGALVLYVERGGRTFLTWSEIPEILQPAADALALAVRDGVLGKLSVERADGEGLLDSGLDSPLATALANAGFHVTPKGLRLRA